MTDARSDAARARLIHGRIEPLPDRVEVRAGPLALVLEAGDVRHVHVGGREVVRRIYAAVRDHQWHTIPARLEAFALERGADAFTCRYHAVHRQDAVAFTWTTTIEGRADGTLTFAVDGVADATFDRNRIGLCLLHPLPLLSGGPVRITTTAGETRDLVFPDLVTVEQPIAGFHDIAAIACEIGPDLWLEAAVEGEIFETEDQRNWTDASTKTYSTPSSLPKPVRVPAGTRIRQRVTLKLRTAAGAPAQPGVAPFVVDRERGEVRFGDGVRGRMPDIGTREGAVARVVRPAHVRLDLDLTEPDAATRLAEASAAQRGAEGPPIELALHVPAEAADAGASLTSLAPLGLTLARVLAFTAGHDTTQPATLDAVRAWLTRHPAVSRVPVATGTPGDLARIHLAPLRVHGDALTWAMDPQAHATDLTTIAESPDGARDQARSARARWPHLPLALAASLGRHGHPDPRAGSLFAAAWTLALLGALGEGGADSVTLLETWPDVADASALPVAHVLAALTPLRGAPLRPAATTIDTVRAIHVEAGGRDVLFLANLAARRAELSLPAADGPWTTWFLDADTAALGAGHVAALTGPELATAAADRVTLGPCAIVRLDRPRR